MLGTTRFNTASWIENMRYREKKQHSGCIYGTPKQITETLTLHQPMFVLEMQNDMNKMPGRSKRRGKSDKNTISLDI